MAGQIIANAHGQRVALDRRIEQFGIPDVTILDDEAIAALDRERNDWRPTCLGCHQQLVLRRYPNRTDRFYWAHMPGQLERCAGPGASESAQHLELKYAIGRAGHVAGWQTDFEVDAGERKRADVVFSKGKAKRSMEAQLSALETPLALRRNAAYAEAFGADPVWLHTGYRMWSTQIPSVRLNDERDTAVGGIYTDSRAEELIQPLPLNRVVAGLLGSDKKNPRFTYVYGGGNNESQGGFGFFFDRRAPSRPRKARTPKTAQQKEAELHDVGGSLLCDSIDLADLAQPYEVRPDRGKATLQKCPRCGCSMWVTYYAPCIECRKRLRANVRANVGRTSTERRVDNTRT